MKQPNDYRLSEKEFWEIYKKVPRLTVEVIVHTDKGVLLTKRDIEPCKGLWHLPGGTVYLGESLAAAVKRVAKRELGIDVTSTKFLDYIEYPSHFKAGMGSPVGLAFQVDYSGDIQINSEASESGWFKEVPADMHPYQDTFLASKVL